MAVQAEMGPIKIKENMSANVASVSDDMSAAEIAQADAG